MLGLSIPEAKKARYLLPMMPMVAIIAAYPFHRADGRLFKALRGLMLALWAVSPGLLMGALVVARHRFGAQLEHFQGVVGLLIGLQVVVAGMLLKWHWRPVGPAFCAVLAVWSVYILVVEPLERRLYDTRTFAREAHALIRQHPAPLVLHGLGKDAKAIKFMVNVECDRVPLFTQAPGDLAAVPVPAWLVMDKADFMRLDEPRWHGLTPVLTGQFDKNTYVLLHLGTDD